MSLPPSLPPQSALQLPVFAGVNSISDIEPPHSLSFFDDHGGPEFMTPSQGRFWGRNEQYRMRVGIPLFQSIHASPFLEAGDD